MNIKKILAGAAASAIMLGAMAIPAFAAPAVLFGDATIVAGGNPGNAASLPSDTSLLNGYSGVVVSPSAPIPWAGLTTLSTDYNVTDDDCFGGSPRYSLGVDTNADNTVEGYVHIAIGPSPSFSGCAPGWQSTGNLIGNADAGRYDYSQFGGSPFTTYSGAPASVLAGNVVEAFIVVDSSWGFADSEQTILVDNVLINTDNHTFDPVLVGPPTNKDECKKDGWKTFNNPTFRNQGDCVSYVQSNPNATGNKKDN